MIYPIIVGVIALFIGVFHRKSDDTWMTRKEQRQERKALRSVYERRTIKDFPFNH